MKIKVVVLIAAFLMSFSLYSNADIGDGNVNETAAWQAVNVKDAFGDDTGAINAIYKGHFKGVYSNSAVTQNPLYVGIRFDHNGTAVVVLYQNRLTGNSLKKHSSNKAYIVVVRDKSGDDHKFTGYSFTSSINFSGRSASKNSKSVVDLFGSGEDLKILIYGRDRTVERYYFVIPSAELSGFNEALELTRKPTVK